MELTDMLLYMLGQAPLVTVTIVVLYVLYSRDLQRQKEEANK